MGALGGLVWGIITAVLLAALSIPMTANLSPSVQLICVVSLAAVGFVVGFLTAGATIRRHSWNQDNFGFFTVVAGSVWGAAIGGALALALSVCYLAAYSSGPSLSAAGILLLATYPSLFALGCCLGACAGIAVGLVTSTLFRVFHLRHQD